MSTALEIYSPVTNVASLAVGVGGGYWSGKKVYEIRKRDSKKTGLFVPILVGVLAGSVASKVTAEVLSAIGI